MQCGALPAGLDLEVFDFGVNSGPAESVKTLQRLVGVTQDGSVGPITLAAVATVQCRRLDRALCSGEVGVLPEPQYARVRTGLGDAGRSNPDRRDQDA